SIVFFFFSSRRRHTRSKRDWSSDVCSISVDGKDGGPFTITYGSLLSGINVSPLTVPSIVQPSPLGTLGLFTAGVTTTRDGGLVAADVLNALKTIPDLANATDIMVTTPVATGTTLANYSPTGGQFVVTFNPAGGLANRDVPLLTTAVTGGSTATVAIGVAGVAGI